MSSINTMEIRVMLLVRYQLMETQSDRKNSTTKICSRFSTQQLHEAKGKNIKDFRDESRMKLSQLCACSQFVFQKFRV